MVADGPQAGDERAGAGEEEGSNETEELVAARMPRGRVARCQRDELGIAPFAQQPVRFADGSLATIAYTALGDASASKERIEAYAGGSVGLLEDFRSLSIVAGGKTTLNVTYRNAAGSVGKATIAITLPDGVAFSSSKCARRTTAGARIRVKSLGRKSVTCRIVVTTSGLKRATVTARGTLTPAADPKKTAKGSSTLVILPLPAPAPEPVTG